MVPATRPSSTVRSTSIRLQREVSRSSQAKAWAMVAIADRTEGTVDIADVDLVERRALMQRAVQFGAGFGDSRHDAVRPWHWRAQRLGLTGAALGPALFGNFSAKRLVIQRQRHRYERRE
jgi:hypothetical protein